VRESPDRLEGNRRKGISLPTDHKKKGEVVHSGSSARKKSSCETFHKAFCPARKCQGEDGEEIPHRASKVKRRGGGGKGLSNHPRSKREEEEILRVRT